MGVGTLIIFISLLLVAAIAAGVLIQTSGSLQEKALTTGDQAKGEISTSIRVTEVSGTDGTDGELTDFSYIAMLSGGSDPIKLDQTIFTINTYDRTATLQYRGADSVPYHNNLNGYNTFAREEMGSLRIWETHRWRAEEWVLITYTGDPTDLGLDLDGDGTNDTVMTCYSGIGGDNCPAEYLDTHLEFNLSTGGAVYAPLRNDNGSLSNLSSQDGINITYQEIGDGYGYFSALRDSGSAAGRIARALDPCSFEVHTSRINLSDDLDGDQQEDYFAVNQTHAIFLLSNSSAPFGIALNEALTGGNALDVYGPVHNSSGQVVAYLNISGTTTAENQIDSDVQVLVLPENEGSGYFSVEYMQTGSNHIDGNLQRGDLIKIHFEGPRAIGEDEEVRLNFVPKLGTATLTEFITPEVITEERIYLYP